MANSDLFSLSTLLDALPRLRFPAVRDTTINQEPPMIPPPPPPPPPPPRGISFSFCCAATPQELELRLQETFNLMTNSQEDVAQLFKDMISKFDRGELQRMASFLTSDSDYFMAIARTKYGSKRLQKLLGKSDEVDSFFSEAITRLFIQVMTDKYASYVAIRGIQVFDRDKKESISKHILQYAFYLAQDQHGCIALNEIITDLDDPYYRNQLLDMVANNALSLSYDVYGNFVVQHVLKIYNLHCTHNIAANLRGHYVELSSQKHGSYIVERLLEADNAVMKLVVMEFLECEENRLMRLARSEYGNFVVSKALEVTNYVSTAPLYWGLVDKLMSFRHVLRWSPGRNIADILDSI